MITVVSGYMRSGTSVMMEALAKCGLDAVWSEDRQKRLTAKFGREFKYCEIDPTELEKTGFELRFANKLIKVHMPGVLRMPPTPFRVVVMRRGKKSIVKSLRELSKNPNVTLDGRQDDIEDTVTQCTNILRDRKSCTDLKEVWLEDFVSDPSKVLGDLNWGFNPAVGLRDLVRSTDVNNGF